MTDLTLLDTYVKAVGMPVDDIALAAGIKSRRLKLLLSGKEEFKASEMISLSKVLELSGPESEKVFFEMSK